jgi:hypothetical protein
MSIKQVFIYAHAGQITGIAFDNEARNFTGNLVHDYKVADPEKVAEELAGFAPRGVGSVWPPEGASFTPAKVELKEKPARKQKAA